MHAKSVHTELGIAMNSVNWTTVARADVELGVEMHLGTSESEELRDKMTDVIQGGSSVQEVKVIQKQRNQIAPVTRGRAAEKKLVFRSLPSYDCERERPPVA